MYRLLVLLLLAGTANAVTVTQEQLALDGSPNPASGEGGNIGRCISEALQGQAVSAFDGCIGTVTLDAFSSPVSDVNMIGTGFVADVFDGAYAVAFDSSGNYLGSCIADTVFDTYSQPQFAGPCSTFLGKSSNAHDAYNWSEQFSLNLPFDNISYVAVVPMSDGGTAGEVVSYTAHQDASSVPEPSTLALTAFGLLGLLRSRKRETGATCVLLPVAEG